jgi:transcription elongation factor GreA
LTGHERQAISKRLRDAIQMGDLSENADYHKAKEDQGFLEGRIQELEYILKNATIVEKNDGPKSVVSFGDRVTIQEDGNEKETYHIVGAKEADPRTGKISNESPMGLALLDHHIGDIVELTTPGGNSSLKIIAIE